MPILAQAIPGESVVNETVNGAWENLPPEAAALFIVLILLLVGGMFLSYTYMKTYGARVQEKKDEKVAAQPQQTYVPGMKTLSLLNNLRGSDVREMALRDEPNKTGVDAAQEVKLDAMKEHIKRLEKEVDNLRKWKERKTKQWVEDSATRQKEEKLRTRDMITLSQRIAKLEIASGKAPGGSGITYFSTGDTLPPTSVSDDDQDDETMG
jgi:hypothetical protein